MARDAHTFMEECQSSAKCSGRPLLALQTSELGHSISRLPCCSGAVCIVIRSTFPTFIFSQSLSQRSKLKFGQFWIKSWQAFSSVNGQTCKTYSSPQEYMQVLTSARTATLVLPTCSVICWQCRQDATSRIETLTCSSSHTHQMQALKAFHIDAIEQKYASCCSDVWSQPCPPSVHAYGWLVS